MTIAYFNGDFLPLDDVRISPLDRGFLYADGVYEVIPVYAGHLFRTDEHLTRLAASLAAVRLEDPMDRRGWHAMLEDLVGRNGGGHQSLYVQVTRGVAPREHAFPAGVSPTVFAMTRLRETDIQVSPVKAVTRPDIRWGRCDIKSVALLANVLARQEAADEEADEAILIRDGFLTEGASSNVFVVSGSRIITPPKGPSILPGITRDLVLDLARQADLDVLEAPIPEPALREADEVWITSSTRELTPVVRLDGAWLGNGAPGVMWERMHDAFRAFKARLTAGAPG